MTSTMRFGIVVYGAAAIVAGIADLVFGSLDPDHQPLQAWGNVPGQHVIAYVLAIMLVAGGAAMLARRSVQIGAVILGIAYLGIAIFWLPRFYTAPQVLGHGVSVYIGILGGVCQELVVAAAAVFAYDAAADVRSPALGRLARTAWIVFGLSSIDFGLVHLTTIQANVVYVPAWMPFGQSFWVVFTGASFVLAGIGILSGVLDVLAARLLAIMWLVFSAFTLLPGLVATPHDLSSWGGNAYNVIAAASAWILADWLAARHEYPSSALSRSAQA